MKTLESVPQHCLLEQLPIATALIDKNHRLVDASLAWLKLFDLDTEAFQNSNVHKLFGKSPEVYPESLKSFFSADTNGRIRHKKAGAKEEIWLESTISKWFDDKENHLGSIIQTMDISTTIACERSLLNAETLLRAKSEVARVGSWEFDLVTEKLTWSKVTKEIHEVPPSYNPSVNEGIEFYKQGYSRNTISMLFHKILKDGVPYQHRLIIITAKGEEKWVAAGGKAIWRKGKIVKIIGTFQDINDQVLAEIKTRESQELLTTLIDNLPINVFIKDKDSRKVLVNKAECDYLNATKEELIGKTDFDIYDKKIAQISRDEDIEVIRSLKPIVGMETISVKKDGTVTNFLTSKIPLLDNKGNANGLIGMSLDITHIKHKENELRDLINITAIQNKKLTNFAHIVSHNLRSHTANFSMLLDFLMKEKEEKEKLRILKMLSNASDNLLDTLENLNEVVDIGTNVNLEKKSMDLNENITRVKQNLIAFLEKNRVEFKNNIPENLKVMCVPAYLESIILNLLTNAVKYRKPNITPVIELTAKKQEKCVVFSITDNGLGIDLKRYGGKIFGMYKTFHNNKDARGLGLYIIKNQLEAINGNITVDSVVGEGTTFNVYFNEEDQ